MWVAQRHVRAEGLDMDLYATVLVLADGDVRAALIDLDLCFLGDRQAAAIRRSVGDAAGIPHDHVLPFCTHSHAGPITLEGYRGEGEDRVFSYIQTLPHLIAGAAVTAVHSTQPARIAVGMGRSDIGVNRDLRLPDGRFVVGNNPAGFSDPEVGVIRIDTVRGEPLACIVNYACHPTVLGPGNKLISPDYPGNTRRIVEQVTGATCFFLQGAGGNVGPVETFVADASVARRLGARLGLEAARVYLGLDTRPVQRRLRSVIESGAALAEFEEVPVDAPAPRLGVANGIADLPMRSPLAEVYEKAPEELVVWKARLADLMTQRAAPDVVAAAFQRVTRIQLRADRLVRYKGKKSLPVEVHAVRIGDAAIAAISGEPYSEIGAAVKRRSPFAGKTLFAGYVDGDMMYIPTAEVFRFQPPPMEVDNSPYTPEAEQVAVDRLVQLLATCQ
jgi:hypothetical protein